MATQKYIGARYMPKFMGTYDATTAYEALSVVDNGSGTTYVANKPVPAGTPLTDPDYWVVYGASSGAILDLQNRMGTAENNIGTLQNDMSTAQGNITGLQTSVGNLQKDVGLLKNRKFILIGDSYGNYPTPSTGWFTYLKAYAGLTEGVDVWSSGIASSAFGDATYPFVNCLSALDLVISDDDKLTVTDIIVGGGVNDRLYGDAAIMSGINTFITYAAAHYPNAKIHLACIGLCKIADQMWLYYDRAVKNYKLATQYPKVDYIDDSELIFNNYALLDIDNIHPTSGGSMLIARGLANWIKNGAVRFEYDKKATTYAHNTAILSSGDMAMWEYNNGNHVSVDTAPIVFSFSAPQPSGELLLGTAAQSNYIFGYLTFIVFNLPCVVTLSDSSVHYLEMEFYIKDGSLYVLNELANTVSIGAHRASFVAPNMVC